VPGEKLVDALCRIVLKASEDVGEPCERVDVVELGGLDQGIDGGGAMAAFVRASEGPVASASGHGPHGPLGGVVADAGTAILEEASESVPAVKDSLNKSSMAARLC
jgi:hypothetical protein